MKLRFRAWLLIALLALTANFGVQVSRVAPPRTSSAIVFCDESGRIQENAVEARPPRIPFRTTPAPRFVSSDTPRAEAAQHWSLFQRPPPAPLSIRL
ncbi:MAG: hypothetical protein ABI811_12830 [Acidobacteriota bacterium]